MRAAAWNVNGIRARQAQFAEWIERDQPDVVCLQEIKASPEQVPQPLRDLPGYWSHWHGSGGYSGVSLHLRQALFPEPPQFSYPTFDFENRIVQAQVGDLVLASVYVPNGGKDFGAKVSFLKALVGYARELHDAGLSLILRRASSRSNPGGSCTSQTLSLSPKYLRLWAMRSVQASGCKRRLECERARDALTVMRKPGGKRLCHDRKTAWDGQR